MQLMVFWFIAVQDLVPLKWFGPITSFLIHYNQCCSVNQVDKKVLTR